MRQFVPMAMAGLCLAALLAACSQPPGSVQQATRAPDHDIVAAIRAVGAHDTSVVEIAPLRNSAIDGFLDEAHAAEHAGNIPQAIASTDAALGLAPDAPDILQYRAELAVRARDYGSAENYARRSYELGPKLGSLCARNWQTVVEIEQLQGHAAAADNARVSRERCHVDGPVRM